MKRLNPVGSLFGFILTILLFFGLGLSLWIDRGLAFNPGPVTAISKDRVVLHNFTSHAEFEKQCSYCHEPLKTNLANKCKSCHEEVNQQLQTGQGVHSRIANVDECSSCHSEHHGRTFNPTLGSYELFDHSKTGFSLNWHQENYDTTPMLCDECHISEDFSVATNQKCLDCHASHGQNFAQAHTQDFGPNCLGCHDGLDRMQKFDHLKTGYPLEGKHTQVKCTGCHTTNNLKDAPKDCKGCHEEPKVHQGMFEQTCGTCHTSDGWTPAYLENQTFSHLNTAGFSLALHKTDYADQVITCSGCHPTDLQTTDIQTCIDCHTQHDQVFMTDHQQQYGSDCLVCHDGVDRLSNFDHANFFPLDGKHESIQCTDCHTNNGYRGTPTECWQCHQEPEIHAGVFGLLCEYCHGADAWSPAGLHRHNFPLNHGLDDKNLQLECKTCHGDNYVDYTCYNCHDHQPDEITQSHRAVGITEQDLPACANCHPAGTLEKNKLYP